MMENQGHDRRRSPSARSPSTRGATARRSLRSPRCVISSLSWPAGTDSHERGGHPGTADAYFGLDDATPAQWARWHRAMLSERARVLASAGFDSATYDDPATSWSNTTFRQLFLFMYDTSFFDRDAARYRTEELIATWRTRFGRVDEVLLWHAYPRLGFDSRTQFDFYRQMPGGLAGLRAEVCDPLHAHGIRVLVDYNPWDAGALDELATIVDALDADGVMLDTMTDVPGQLARAVGRRRRGVVFAPELRPADEDLATRTPVVGSVVRHRRRDARRLSTGAAGSSRVTVSSR